MNEWNPDLALSSCKLIEPKEVEALGEANVHVVEDLLNWFCLLYTSPSPRDQRGSRMPSSA